MKFVYSSTLFDFDMQFQIDVNVCGIIVRFLANMMYYNYINSCH